MFNLKYTPKLYWDKPEIWQTNNVTSSGLFKPDIYPFKKKKKKNVQANVVVSSELNVNTIKWIFTQVQPRLHVYYDAKHLNLRPETQAKSNEIISYSCDRWTEECRCGGCKQTRDNQLPAVGNNPPYQHYRKYTRKMWLCNSYVKIIKEMQTVKWNVSCFWWFYSSQDWISFPA